MALNANVFSPQDDYIKTTEENMRSDESKSAEIKSIFYNLVKKCCFFCCGKIWKICLSGFFSKLQKRFAGTLIIQMHSSAEKGTKATNSFRAEQARLSGAASVSNFGARQ